MASAAVPTSNIVFASTRVLLGKYPVRLACESSKGVSRYPDRRASSDTLVRQLATVYGEIHISHSAGVRRRATMPSDRVPSAGTCRAPQYRLLSNHNILPFPSMDLSMQNNFLRREKPTFFIRHIGHHNRYFGYFYGVLDPIKYASSGNLHFPGYVSADAH